LVSQADATDAEKDPDRRAWHRARATPGPDEEVAAELERSGGRAQARGGLAAAAAFLQRAVALTVDPARRAERALAAAPASLQAGAFDAALGLVATADAGPLDEFQRARVDLLRAHIAFASGLADDAPPLLLKAAKRLEAFDLDLARETYLTAWSAAGMAGSLAGPQVLLEICRAVRALPPSPVDPRPLELLLYGLALLTTDGHAAAIPILQRAAKLLTSIPVADVLRWGHVAARASVIVWDYEGMHAICARHVQLVRDAGALTALSFHLTQLGMARQWLGDFAGAEVLVAEEASVAAATGSPIAPYTLLRLRALQGREAEAAAAIASAVEHAKAGGRGRRRTTRTGRPRSCTTVSPATRRRRRRPGKPPRTPSTRCRQCVRCPTLSRGPRAQETPSVHARRSSGWWRSRSPAATTSHSARGSLPGVAERRCGR
jgi:tetratricopeptide (TPR) repeat protein